MKKNFFLIFVVFFFNVNSFDDSKIIDCKEAMALLDRTVKSFKSFEGKFVHKITSLENFADEVEEGKIFLKKGGKIKFNYTKPEGKIAVSNGKTAFIYIPEDNCVYKIKIPFNSKIPPLLKIVMGKVVPSKEFFCAFSTKRGDVTTIELGLMEKDPSFRRVEVAIDEKSAFFSKINYVDQFNNKVVFEFFEGISNKGIPEDTFNFIPPEGTKIIESLEYFEEEFKF
mgnify:CR=1 FL=1